jgi:hypothetical protein
MSNATVAALLQLQQVAALLQLQLTRNSHPQVRADVM